MPFFQYTAYGMCMYLCRKYYWLIPEAGKYLVTRQGMAIALKYQLHFYN